MLKKLILFTSLSVAAHQGQAEITTLSESWSGALSGDPCRLCWIDPQGDRQCKNWPSFYLGEEMSIVNRTMENKSATGVCEEDEDEDDNDKECEQDLSDATKRCENDNLRAKESDTGDCRAELEPALTTGGKAGIEGGAVFAKGKVEASITSQTNPSKRYDACMDHAKDRHNRRESDCSIKMDEMKKFYNENLECNL